MHIHVELCPSNNVVTASFKVSTDHHFLPFYKAGLQSNPMHIPKISRLPCAAFIQSSFASKINADHAHSCVVVPQQQCHLQPVSESSQLTISYLSTKNFNKPNTGWSQNRCNMLLLMVLEFWVDSIYCCVERKRFLDRARYCFPLWGFVLRLFFTHSYHYFSILGSFLFLIRHLITRSKKFALLEGIRAVPASWSSLGSHDHHFCHTTAYCSAFWDWPPLQTNLEWPQLQMSLSGAAAWPSCPAPKCSISDWSCSQLNWRLRLRITWTTHTTLLSQTWRPRRWAAQWQHRLSTHFLWRDTAFLKAPNCAHVTFCEEMVDSRKRYNLQISFVRAVMQNWVSGPPEALVRAVKADPYKSLFLAGCCSFSSNVTKFLLIEARVYISLLCGLQKQGAASVLPSLCACGHRCQSINK